MAMEIKPAQTGISPSSMQKPLQANATSDMSNRATSTDTVTVTSAAEGMLEMEKTLSNLPSSNDERISAIKALIYEGQFHIDAGKIAEKLIEQELDLL
jgi:flagellar biosynthesis anti-sigma factor FlgM